MGQITKRLENSNLNLDSRYNIYFRIIFGLVNSINTYLRLENLDLKFVSDLYLYIRNFKVDFKRIIFIPKLLFEVVCACCEFTKIIMKSKTSILCWY